MTKRQEAKRALSELGMPVRQTSDMCCLVLLSLLRLSPKDDWSKATSDWLRIHDVILFLKKAYRMSYAENSRETIRKAAMHPFRDAAIIEDNGLATNSPNYRYRITPEALDCFRAFGTESWGSLRDMFLSSHTALKELYASRKRVRKTQVQVGSEAVSLSSGLHNQLQKAVMEEFIPRFAVGASCLYLGDASNRNLFYKEEAFKELGFSISVHDKLPDIVLHDPARNWIYFIECVTSVGPMSPQRVIELRKMSVNASSGKVFITAFPDFKTYKRFSDKLAWETEVWISNLPDHMLHLNGDRFIGPRGGQGHDQ